MDYPLTSSVQIFTRIMLTCIILLTITSLLFAQTGPKSQSLFAQENLVAWCIVPFDSQHRTPAERIAMLKRLNFSEYAYDWRHEHLPSFPEEIRLAKQNKVHIAAVWMWIDNETDRPGRLSDDNEKLLQIVKETGLFTQLWVGFNSNFFTDEDEKIRIKKGVEMLTYLRERTNSIVSGIGLYNHGDWFGEPENQIKILKELNDPGMGLIYNFHHAHGQIESFPTLLKKMSPWLWTVNVNGMKKDGPQILPIGSGNRELDMLRTLKKSGFHGSIGILGHIEDEDVEVVLKRNLNGLRKLEKEL
ncbi:MAG: hypothetical protein OEV24_16230 [Cyclobacteriaceae bacterium]|jgi:hypothetical protein|nr:hypothetical protein [Cyclobacteriaceae bacterium]